MSIELDLEEVKDLARKIGFEICVSVMQDGLYEIWTYSG
jgi:hypothetical protein